MLGSTFASINEINFLNCSEADDCEFEKTLIFPDYLSLSANTLSLENSLFVTDTSPDKQDDYSVKIEGDVILTGNLDEGGENLAKLELNTLPEFQGLTYSPIVHTLFGKTTIQGDMILSRSPIIRTSFHIEREVFSKKFRDSDDLRNRAKIDPDKRMNDDPNQFPESYIKNLQVQYNSKIEDAVVVKQNLYGRNLKDSETIYVGGSLNVSDTLTSNYFQDSDNSQYRVDPFPENILTPTRLKNLSLRGNLVVTDISSAKNFVSTADFFTESNLTLTEGDFTSANTIRTSILEDYQDSNYKVEMSGLAELLSLKLNQTMTGVNIDSNNASKIVSVVGNSQSKALTLFGNTKVFMLSKQLMK